MKNKQNKINEETIRGSIDYEYSYIANKKINFLLSDRNKTKSTKGKKQLDINISFDCPCCRKGLAIHLQRDLT